MKRVRLRAKHSLLIPLLIGGAYALSSCSTPPPAPVVTVKERIQFDRMLGKELSQQLEPQLKFRKEPEVTRFLAHLARRLADASPDPRTEEVSVQMIEGAHAEKSLGLPGGRIYLPVKGLRRVSFENEMAAAVSLELAHIQLDDLVERYNQDKEKQATPDFFGSDGLFAYDEKAEIAATEAAVGILYRAGYDPRGMVRFWEREREGANASGAPYDARLVERLVDTAHHAIAARAPLRDPIVRSQAFMTIRKRIEKL